MLTRHRLSYAALGGFLAVILGASLALAQEKKPPVLKDQPVSQGQKTPDKKRAEAESQKNAPPPEQLTPALRQIESAIRELVNQQRAAQEKGPAQHEIKDLKAQDDMAFWAKLMFFATMVAVGLTGFGIWLIKRTLDETSVAAKHTEGMLEEAKKTTEAAHAAIKATDKAAERQLRAYVGFADISLDWSKETIIVTKIRFINKGQTPAYKVRLFANFSVGQKTVDFTSLPPEPSQIIADLPIDGRFNADLTGAAMDRDLAAKARSGDTPLFVWGVLEYEDTFGEPRETAYRYRWDRSMSRLIAIPEGNYST